MKTQQYYQNQSIEGLHIETGGSILVSPIASNIPVTQQPSNSKIIFVFSIAIFLGCAIGWFLNSSFTKSDLKKAELSALTAKLELDKNKEQIDNFCRANSSIRSGASIEIIR